MRAVPAWVDKVHDREKVEQCIYDLCFNPEGTRLIVAAGQRVLVYDTTDGSLIHPLKGHKDTVYCVCYAQDGKKFASGSADKSVIIWTSNLEGILKYSHNDALQCLAYNPVTHHLASCAISDFAFWSPEFKAVQKYKSNARINTCAWTNDGQYLALGLSNGSVSIRNKSGEEKGRIERPDVPQAPVWSVAWNPSTEEDILCIGDWGQTISFYTIGGKLVGKERHVGYDPLCINYIKGDYLLVSGTNCQCSLMTRDGIKLGTIGDQQQSWVWCCAARSDSSFVALGCQDGTIAYYQLLFNTVHGLYREKYAYRENMTDVIIQHLLTDEKVRIKCRDLIKKIAIYKNRLAVQLPERVVIYELYDNGEQKGMHYRVKEKISKKLECNLLVVCTNHLVLCQERKLQSLSFDSVLEREWFMDSPIRYIKVIGGPAGREGLLLGLKNGQVCKIYLDNAFPVNMVKIGSAIRCLDQNESLKKLAIVTENNQCLVYNTDNQELLFQEPNANSVAWNSDIEDMLCFSGNDILSVKAGNFPVHQQKLMGFVVGFSGSKVFCLHVATMSAIEVPLSAPMYQYIEKKMFQEAYTVACLGVTQSDWQILALAALEGYSFDIARLAFQHVQDLRHVDLISDFQARESSGEKNQDVFMGDILSFNGKFKEAAQVYRRCKQEEKALNMYTDLRMFDLAQEFLGSVDSADQKALIRKKADWARDINELKAAAWMYFSAGDVHKAVEMAGENKWPDVLADIAGRLDKADRPSLELVAEHFRRLGEADRAAEVYRRLGDDKSVVGVFVEAGQWNEAFSLAEKNPDLRDLVYAPYALWLAERSQFAEAQKAFHKAGRPEEAFKVLHQLTLNAVEESRLQDAGYYYWILARQCLEIANQNQARKEEMVAKYCEHEKLAAIYYAYDFIERYIDEPFLSCLPEGLFNIARFLIHETEGLQLQGISQFFIHYTLAKQGRNLGAFKTTHQVLKKIQTLCIPPEFEDNVGLGLILNRTKPYNDNEELLPMCYRCSTYNALWSKTGNSCSNCLHPFMYSFIYFEVLPLVEFKLEPGILVEEAVTLIQVPTGQSSKAESWSQSAGENFQTLQLDDGNDDPFTARLMEFENLSQEYVPVTADRATLKAMDPTSVIICRWPEPLEWQFYKNVLPDLPVTLCNSCNKIFYVDDFEKQVLQKSHCPFCRSQQTEYLANGSDASPKRAGEV